MKVLITGKNSYIGKHVRAYLEEYGHTVAELDTLSDEWKSFDYSSYDSIVHVAAIVHENAKKASEEIFKKVNTDLPFEIAKIAKSSGVKQFVFMSTMAVYGCEKKLPRGNVIDENTPLKPTTLYGKSKLEAEKLLQSLEDDAFRVAIIRPPNVYGKDCPGNYMNAFKNIALKIPVFPDAYRESKQSMLYIDNLSCLINLLVETLNRGIYHPQDDLIPNTCELIELLSVCFRIRKKYSNILGLFIRIMHFIPIIKKVYGGVSYSNKISTPFDGRFQVVSFVDGIEKTFS